jgi:hypothetical protein
LKEGIGGMEMEMEMEMEVEREVYWAALVAYRFVKMAVASNCGDS